MDTLKRVLEASYLTVEKAWSYRAILRYFFIQHERMREFIFPEEIYEHVFNLQGFEEYTEEQLHQDLDQLVKWNNLVARQETGRARTIEEFKKKRFRYQCTPYTVEFERTLQAMEKSGESFGGSLEKKEFERLHQELYRINSLIQKTTLPNPDECSQIWNDMFTHFSSIIKNTSDYIAHINSEEAEERMQTESFFVFKDQFTTYLRDFIIELQQTSLKIQHLLQTLNINKLQPFIKRVVMHQQTTPHFKNIAKEEQDLLNEEIDKWKSLAIWFLGNEHGGSELEMLEIRTNEQIRRITRIVQRLGERHHHFRSRKKDYLYLAKWFDSLSDVNESHKLSSVVFGMSHTRHVFSDHIPTDDIYTSIWEENPIEYETKPRIRQYREKTKANAIVSQNKLKEAAKQAHLKNKKIEQTSLEKYMHNNEIHLDKLPVIEPYVRKMFLNWIGRAMMRKDRTLQTEHGKVVKVNLIQKERMILYAEDGNLDMPKVVFQFLEKEQ